MVLKVTRCNGEHCRAVVHWSRTTNNNRTIPLDPDPVAGGNIRLNDDGTCTVMAKAEREAFTGPTYVAHHTTCADRDAFKQKQKARSA